MPKKYFPQTCSSSIFPIKTSSSTLLVSQAKILASSSTPLFLIFHVDSASKLHWICLQNVSRFCHFSLLHSYPQASTTPCLDCYNNPPPYCLSCPLESMLILAARSILLTPTSIPDGVIPLLKPIQLFPISLRVKAKSPVAYKVEHNWLLITPLIPSPPPLLIHSAPAKSTSLLLL